MLWFLEGVLPESTAAEPQAVSRRSFLDLSHEQHSPIRRYTQVNTVEKILMLGPLVSLLVLASCSLKETSRAALPVVGNETPAEGANLCGNRQGRLAFASYRDGESEIYSVNADGTGLTRLTHDEERLSKPAWSPDGKSIVYVVTDEEFNVDIYLMKADGSNQARLTTDRWVDTEPAWDPTGGRIVFSSDRDSYLNIEDEKSYEMVYEFEIYVMDANGSGQTNLTDSPGWDTAPAWSPDGGQIAFQSNRDGNPEIYMMDADGSRQVNLTNHPEDDAAPALSPDGSKIAFQSDRTGVFNIYVMETDGTGLVQLTNSPDWDIEPAWSTDGQYIAFYSGRAGNFEIYVMNADGSCQVRLTNHGDFDGFPDWRP